MMFLLMLVVLITANSTWMYWTGTIARTVFALLSVLYGAQSVSYSTSRTSFNR
jgi:hypothetical protein